MVTLLNAGWFEVADVVDMSVCGWLVGGCWVTVFDSHRTMSFAMAGEASTMCEPRLQTGTFADFRGTLQNGSFAESVVLSVLGFCESDAQNARTEARGIGKVGGSYLGVQNGLKHNKNSKFGSPKTCSP